VRPVAIAGGVGPPARGEPFAAEEGLQAGLGRRLRAGPGREGGDGHEALPETWPLDRLSPRRVAFGDRVSGKAGQGVTVGAVIVTTSLPQE